MLPQWEQTNAPVQTALCVVVLVAMMLFQQQPLQPRGQLLALVQEVLQEAVVEAQHLALLHLSWLVASLQPTRQRGHRHCHQPLHRRRRALLQQGAPKLLALGPPQLQWLLLVPQPEPEAQQAPSLPAQTVVEPPQEALALQPPG